ncbi:FAD-binding oxidoreductase [Desulfosarcina ovata]|uniref:FAD-binding protein n=1 Tax=Desulfosarcina ovata subsp. ovata TaxID=2752305 RepID=A0A5K8AHN2_9BACT|nr:FAD-linked oxidase C-terminal domain-containing protein [Desulfosarcina ovata]BBO92177.1 FAD-binding protein [Desulfosarcina ovata subsp. ovata]
MQDNARRQLRQLLGPENFLEEREDCLTYAFDASEGACLPEAVAFPETAEAVSEILAIANTHRIPIVPRGAGSGLTGGAVPLSGGIVMTMNRMNRIISVDTDNLQAIVQPGVITARLHAAVEAKGLFYPPDPASMDICTIGGNLAENAGGMRAVKYGVTKDFVMGLEVVLANGEIIHTGSRCIKDVVGYDLTRLFVGSEGTLGVITRAVLKLLPLPEGKQTLLAAFGAMEAAAQTIADVIKSGIIPTTMEFMDKHCIRAVTQYQDTGLPVDAEAVLLIEVDGTPHAIETGIKRVQAVCTANRALSVDVARDVADQERLWQSRRAIHAALGLVWPRWEEEDIAVPIARVPKMVRRIDDIAKETGAFIVCFGHAGDGNIHVSLAPHDKNTPHEALTQARAAILKDAIALEGRIAAEHGIGLIKRNQIGWNLDAPTLNLMRQIKGLLDPNGILNPGKVFPSTLTCSAPFGH